MARLQVEAVGRAVDARGRDRRGAVVRAARALRRDAPPGSNRLALAARDGVVSDRDRESVVRSPGARRAVRRPARPRDAVGVRQARGVRRRARRTCRWSRAARRRSSRQTNAELIATAHGELLEALPAVARRQAAARAPSSASRARRFRSRRASRRARRRRRPFTGLFLAGDWIDTGLPATIESAVARASRPPTVRLRTIRRT